MASQVDICNSALRKLGAGRLSSMDEDSKEAELCRDAYDQIRRRLLRANPWNFAQVRKTLAQTASDPLNEWAYSFQLPTDCLKVVKVVPYDMRYVVEGRELLCNSADVSIKYTKDAELVNDFDSAFFEVLAFELALDMCVSLTDSASIEQLITSKYANYRSEAQTEDAQENTDINYLSDDVFLKARDAEYYD